MDIRVRCHTFQGIRKMWLVSPQFPLAELHATGVLWAKSDGWGPKCEYAVYL